ncbi:MAG: ribosome small subunit-dependent GTPase A [Rhodobacter sp.]|nr:ribosome small subunit-dependent GTPase A [Rhodobacter sp.]
MTTYTLTGLGWSDHFARQLDEPGLAQSPQSEAEPLRLSAIHRDRMTGLGARGAWPLISAIAAGDLAVGDWVLAIHGRIARRLQPRTELVRRAAGPGAGHQLIAANVDTLGIVTSCNADFNIARLERYLALAATAGCLPLVVVTKADLDDTPQDYVRAAQRLSPLVTALALDARDPQDAARLAPWCGPGQTLALVGSSGVGKTTLYNALTGKQDETRDIRQDDARGRHTTTARHLFQSGAGGWLIDTPGMRELQLTDASEGIAAVFDDIETLARGCRFADCTHESEPGCAVQVAIAAGALDPGRLHRWRKLGRENRRNSETLAEARRRDRSFGKMVRNALRDKNGRR